MKTQHAAQNAIKEMEGPRDGGDLTRERSESPQPSARTGASDDENAYGPPQMQQPRLESVELQQQLQEQLTPGQEQQVPEAGSTEAVVLQWTVMRVRMLVGQVVSIPAGCMLHVEWVSLVTLLSVLVCSGMMVAAAIW